MAPPGQKGPHERSPSKHPRARLGTLEDAGRLKIPFTTGILIGIGETMEERVASLLVIKELQERYGHIQEVIVQNLRAKAGTPMSSCPDAPLAETVRTIVLARIILGPRANIQAPPNLAPGDYGAYLRAGINDWGGISPVTRDYVNPEASWPSVRELAEVSRSHGFELRARLPVYPEYLSKEWITPHLLAKAQQAAPAGGYVAKEEPH